MVSEFDLPRVEHNASPFADELLRDREADPSRRTCNERDPTVQVRHSHIST